MATLKDQDRNEFHLLQTPNTESSIFSLFHFYFGQQYLKSLEDLIYLLLISDSHLKIYSHTFLSFPITFIKTYCWSLKYLLKDHQL